MRLFTTYSLFKDIYAAYLEDFNKNTHTWEKRAIGIDERQNIEDNFNDTLSLFLSEKIHRNKNRCLTEINKSLGIPCTISKPYHPGLLQCKIPVESFIFSRVLKIYSCVPPTPPPLFS